jgi:hypothetical protein
VTNTNATALPAFFNGEISLGSGVYYLQFPNGNLFGDYNLANFPIFYHYDMGFEAFIDGGPPPVRLHQRALVVHQLIAVPEPV